jgi:hypothetical protein
MSMQCRSRYPALATDATEGSRRPELAWNVRELVRLQRPCACDPSAIPERKRLSFEVSQTACKLLNLLWSGRPDLNRGPLGPETRGATPHGVLGSSGHRAAGRRDRDARLEPRRRSPASQRRVDVLPSEAMSASPQQSPRQHEHTRVFANCMLTGALCGGWPDSSKSLVYNTIGA